MSNRRNADQAALNHLLMMGSETKTIQPVDFFLYFPEEYQAYSTAAELFNLQFQVSVSYSESSENWLCLATKPLKPTSERLEDLGSFLEKLALAYNGNYDGWGTPLSQDEGNANSNTD